MPFPKIESVEDVRTSASSGSVHEVAVKPGRLVKVGKEHRNDPTFLKKALAASLKKAAGSDEPT